MARANWLRSDWLMEAFRRQRGSISLMVLLQLAQAAVSVIRYHAILATCGVRSRRRDATAATLVSAGVSLWLPASTGVSEILRIGLMCGSQIDERRGLAARVALASLLDRIIGFVMVFAMGAAGALVLQNKAGQGDFAAVSLAALYLSMSGLLVLGMWGLARLARRWNTRRPLRLEQGPNVPRQVRHLASRLRGAIATLQTQPVTIRSLFWPTAMALLIFLFLAMIYLLAIRALGGVTSLAAVTAMLPLFTLAGLLPVSIAGLGGQQLAAIALLKLLENLDPAVVASAGLLNAAVVLLVQSLLAILFAGISFCQIRRLVALRKHKEPLHE